MREVPGEQVRANARRVDFLVRLAVAAAAARADEAAVQLATAAAELGWYRHSGRHRLPRVEALLRQVAERSGVPAGSAYPRTDRRVLHVLTAGYDFGGHSRMAERWIAKDAGREHHVALTEQPPGELPRWLSGVPVTRLDTRRPATERAARLAALLDGFDLAVLHVHPHDPVPVMALHRAATPSVYANHADHACWLDAATSVVAHIRPAAVALAADRRGLPDGVIVPVPIEEPPVLPDRAAARTELGLPADAVVALSVASAFKFEDGRPLLDLLAPVLAAEPRLHLVAVGPGGGGAWDRPRVHPLGVRPNVRIMLAAADLYLDSWPQRSMTSLLEAAAVGLPTVTRLEAGAPAIEEVDAPGLDAGVVARTDGEWRTAVTRLVGSPAARAELGARLAHDVRAAHVDGWMSYVEAAYRAAIEGPRQRRVPPPGFQDTALDRRLAAVYLGDPHYPDLAGVLLRRSGLTSSRTARWMLAAARRYPGSPAAAVQDRRPP